MHNNPLFRPSPPYTFRATSQNANLGEEVKEYKNNKPLSSTRFAFNINKPPQNVNNERKKLNNFASAMQRKRTLKRQFGHRQLHYYGLTEEESAFFNRVMAVNPDPIDAQNALDNVARFVIGMHKDLYTSMDIYKLTSTERSLLIEITSIYKDHSKILNLIEKMIKLIKLLYK